MLSVKNDYKGKEVKVTFVTKTGDYFQVDLDTATQEQLKLLRENDQGQYVTEKKDA